MGGNAVSGNPMDSEWKEPETLSDRTSGDPFAATRWTLVSEARDGTEEALEELLRIYREPIVRHLNRHLGWNDGEDAAQAYLSGLLERGYLGKANRERGKFRAFLLQDLRWFILSWRRQMRAEKRGGKAAMLSIEELREKGIDPVKDDCDWLEGKFSRDWAVCIAREALNRLRAQCGRRGEAESFELLRPLASAPGDSDDYKRIGEQLGKSPEAIKTAVHRFRKQYRDEMAAVVSETLSTGESVEAEMAFLRDCFLDATEPKDD